MKILLALDDSFHGEAAVQSIAEKVQTTDSAVKIMTTVSIDNQSEIDLLHGEKVRGAARAKLAEAVKKLQTFARANLRVTCEIAEGDAATAILDTAERWNADLIVVGSQKRRGLHQFLFGSLSQAVARAAECSVLVVRPNSVTASGNRFNLH